MRAIFVTSEVNFAPRNYDTLISGMADIPEIYGVIIIQNKSWRFLKEALGFIFFQTAPALGWQIVKNFFSALLGRRQRIYTKNGKQIWFMKNLEPTKLLSLIKTHNIDLIINARNHVTIHPQVIKRLPLGCVNIHHGLLPEQKGFMCDFWAHLENRKSGFTLHEMTPHLVEGSIIRRVEVPRSTEGYLEYLERSALLELAVLMHFISEIRTTGHWKAATASLPVHFRFHKLPSVIDYEKFKKTGLNI